MLKMMSVLEDQNRRGRNMMKTVRATKLCEQAGAYYVRVQAMARKYHITLEEEFDIHDTPDTKYIVILDDDFPVATCRLFGVSDETAEIGRVVVLEEYRGQGLGRLAVTQAEKWLAELGFRKVVVNSRDVAVGFYRRLGYQETGEAPEEGATFVCVAMEKKL